MNRDFQIIFCVFVLTVLATAAFTSPASDARQKARPAMDSYRKAHPSCEWCSRKAGILARMEVHHLVPVAVAPDMAKDTNNMITLCRPCHIVVGHDGDGACRRHVVNVRQLIQVKVVAK